MNLYNMALLAHPELITVQIKHADNPQLYTYICHKTISVTLERHDEVLVMNRNGLKPGKVMAVNDHVNIDPDSSHNFNFVVMKIDMEQFEKTKREVNTIKEQLHAIHLQNRREQVLKALNVSEADIGKMLQQLEE